MEPGASGPATRVSLSAKRAVSLVAKVRGGADPAVGQQRLGSLLDADPLKLSLGGADVGSSG